MKFALKPPNTSPSFYECAGANPSLLGMEEFLSRLKRGILAALAEANSKAQDVGSAGFGLSGADRAEQVARIKASMRELLPRCDRFWLGNDALAALRQGAGKAEGLVLIAGTGSVCMGVDAEKRQIRVGGWGGELGDEGSGFWIGRRGLQAACRMADGRLKRTPLLDKILKRFGLAEPEELIAWSSSLSREEFKNSAASLYPIVAEQAGQGDHSAKQCIMLGIGHLIGHVMTAQRRLAGLGGRGAASQESSGRKPAEREAGEPAISPTILVCAGGLFERDEKFFDSFVFQLRRTREGFDPVRLKDPASLGAMALGEEAARTERTEQ